MADEKIICLSCLDELRAHADAWDDLWLRSVTRSPTCRAELMACWVERFASAGRFRALVVERQGRLLAALPLVNQRIGRFVATGGLPVNDWSQCGDLLLDESIEPDDALRSLTAGFQLLPWSLLWLDGVRIETARWQRLEQILRESGSAVLSEPRFEVGWLEMMASLDDVQRSWSKGFRKDLRRSARRLAQQGQYELKLHNSIGDADLEPMFKQAMEVEQRSWKARAGTTMLDSEGMAEFYLRQFRLLAKRQELVIAFLELDGQPIAFEIGWLAKSVYHSFKVGYDQRFARLGPGQFIMYLLIEELARCSKCQAIDCLGPLSEATSHFRPATYTIGRMLIADRHLTGRSMLAIYKNLMPHLRRWRNSRSLSS